jgi:mycothiol synthase
MLRVPPAPVITSAKTDDDLEAMIAVRRAVNPRARPTLANLRHALDSDTTGLEFLVARLGDVPVAAGFVNGPSGAVAYADIVVVPDRRGAGIGAAMLAHASQRAQALGKENLQFEVQQSDERSRAFLERRGFERVGGEEAVTLVLGAETTAPQLPNGVELATLAERPNAAEGMYEVFVEAEQDVPGAVTGRGFEAWRAVEIDRPSRSHDLCFVALVGDEVVGYAVLDVLGDEGRHGFTAVRRDWRRRGVAMALKRAQIAAATEQGLARLTTQSEERNLPMRALNEKLGYRPDPERSIDELRGPLVPSP